jgi:hypothetical protein
MDATTHELFVHVRIVIGMVLGLSITRLMAGLAKLVQHPGREKVYWVHLGWAASTLLFVINFWWWEFGLSQLGRMSFMLFVFVIFYASLFYLLCALLFPDDMKEYAGFEDYFYSRRKWFFGILALVNAVDLVDTLLKGWPYFQHFGLEYPIETVAHIVFCGVAMATANRTFHAIFVSINLAYEITWILRHFDTLPNVPGAG